MALNVMNETKLTALGITHDKLVVLHGNGRDTEDVDGLFRYLVGCASVRRGWVLRRAIVVMAMTVWRVIAVPVLLRL